MQDPILDFPAMNLLDLLLRISHKQLIETEDDRLDVMDTALLAPPFTAVTLRAMLLVEIDRLREASKRLAG
jgi:hypothetical protein